MSQTQTQQKELDSPGLNAALETLKTYDAGSTRAGLIPIDEAVTRALTSSATRSALEQKLLTVLEASASAVAVEYIFSKLALIGSDASVTALGDRLTDTHCSTAARNALEKIPSSAASKVLREAALKLSGSQRTGAIQSLGARRDASAVSICRRLLREADLEAAAAAAFALGEIGSIKAAAVIRDFLSHAPADLRLQLADAALVCAEHLRRAGHNSAPKALYSAVAAGPYPAHIRQSALTGLKNC